MCIVGGGEFVNVGIVVGINELIVFVFILVIRRIVEIVLCIVDFGVSSVY